MIKDLLRSSEIFCPYCSREVLWVEIEDIEHAGEQECICTGCNNEFGIVFEVSCVE